MVILDVFVVNTFHTTLFSHVIIGIDHGRSDVPAPDNKSLGCCCRNSLPTVINPLNKYLHPVRCRALEPPAKSIILLLQRICNQHKTISKRIKNMIFVKNPQSCVFSSIVHQKWCSLGTPCVLKCDYWPPQWNLGTGSYRGAYRVWAASSPDDCNQLDTTRHQGMQVSHWG